ncbi:NAD(P)-binding protein [Aureobasidium pullulans]|uniref:NAD(P)-binding protein n=1 Tax=Aureobasidium pullulans TaxID=5580 RepID=A0A4S9PY11_AURPU|nr:NAD(P)-binding protein [Aureobasidium pullulans]THZ47514.1 NAD(P)-binding protein [Aureobasidium pullulans]THZ62440.1 NAD(P)-binding protein [Aureobasidium pullulans]
MDGLKNIVWVGTGPMGLPMLERITATGKFNIKLLVRNQISSYANIPKGVQSIHQVNYYDHKSLVEHLKGQDIVIVFTSFVPGNELDRKQIALVNAAIDAGVKYFIPSEWAPDTAGRMGSVQDGHGPTLPTDMVLAPKRVTHNYLLCRAAEKKLNFCVIYPGVLFELGFANGIFGFDFNNKTACLPDNGINPFPATTLDTLSKVVISLFENPSLISNKFYHVADGVLTQQDVFHVVEKETGVSWARTSYSTSEVRKAALANMEKGVYGPTEYMHSLMTPFFGGLQVWRHLDNQELKVRNGEVDIREEVVQLVRKQLADKKE